jgi:hypothetical protein
MLTLGPWSEEPSAGCLGGWCGSPGSDEEEGGSSEGCGVLLGWGGVGGPSEELSSEELPLEDAAASDKGALRLLRPATTAASLLADRSLVFSCSIAASTLSRRKR